jgi:hypothetical protein
MKNGRGQSKDISWFNLLKVYTKSNDADTIIPYRTFEGNFFIYVLIAQTMLYISSIYTIILQLIPLF